MRGSGLRGCAAALLVGACGALAACSDGEHHDRERGDAGAEGGDAAPAPDAALDGSDAAPVGDASSPDGADAAPDGRDGAPEPAPVTQATAVATLAPVDPSDSAGPVSGTATFVATPSGVDLTLLMRGCAGAPEKPVRILEARDCSEVSAASLSWGGERGDGVPGVLCTSETSGEGMLRYSRRAAVSGHWAVGDGSSADLVGHAVALFDVATGAPTACGVIERAPERTLVALPAADEAPSVEARAQIGGLCIARLTAGATSAGCASAGEITECAAEHCELGACLERCASYTACLDQSPDRCTATCAPSAECAECQAEVTTCSLAFCGAHMACPAIPEPDGPCSQLAACCTLQGDAAAPCVDIMRLITSVAGRASCVSALGDWDVFSHMHVPCDTLTAWNEAGPPGSPSVPIESDPCLTDADCSGDDLCVGAARTAALTAPGRCLPRAPTSRIDDNAVGTACETDATCGGGQCEARTALLTPYPGGYCSGRCYDDATCGEGGLCLRPVGSSDPGRCLEACESDADCLREHYRCTPLGDGAGVVHACYPREAALPDGVVGLPCSSDADCADGAATCMDALPLAAMPPDQPVSASGGYCSARCLFDVDCGDGAQCISGGMAGGICMSRCDEQTPCREGYSCLEHGRDKDDPAAAVCMPNWE